VESNSFPFIGTGVLKIHLLIEPTHAGYSIAWFMHLAAFDIIKSGPRIIIHAWKYGAMYAYIRRIHNR
jgi:hypothetical protein